MGQATLDSMLRDMLHDVVRAAVHEELTAWLAQQDAPPPASEQDPEFLSAEAAAEIAGVTDKTVRAWVRQDKLRGHWAGRLLRIERKELDRFLKESRSKEHNEVDVDALASELLRKAMRQEG